MNNLEAEAEALETDHSLALVVRGGKKGRSKRNKRNQRRLEKKKEKNIITRDQEADHD